jgi:uncharacterized cupin superfamily protein
MEQITIDELESDMPGGIDRHCLTEALGTEHVACNYYRIPPGDGLPAGLHAHRDQEELFFVLEGEAVFETLDREQTTASERTVAAGEAIRFEPGEYQSGRNAGEAELIVLAFGGPRDSEDVRLPVSCPDCANDELRLETSAAGVTFVCPRCEGKYVPADCPSCGDSAMQMALGEDGDPVATCENCDAIFEEPPLQN